MREWVLGGIVELELWMMPMVSYGLGAWAVLVWIFLTSLYPVRSMAYELFVLQHIASGSVLLWLLWKHVPAYAMYNVWFAIAALSFDWVYRGALLCFRNIGIRMKVIGYDAEVSTRGEDITIITINSKIPFSWSAGQHIYLWIPRLGPFETHPFTIARAHSKSKSNDQVLQFAIRSHSGFSKRLYRYAANSEAQGDTTTLKAFITGPYGSPPNWKAYETLILISASTGASFTLPILESTLDSAKTSCVRRIFLLLLAREKGHIVYYEERLLATLTQAHALGVDLRVEIAITGNNSEEHGISVAMEEVAQGGPATINQPASHNETDGISPVPSPIEQVEGSKSYVLVGQGSHSRSSSMSSVQTGDLHLHDFSKEQYQLLNSAEAAIGTPHPIVHSLCRPVISEWIRDPIEKTGGETTIAVCGGKELVADVRNSVARLSDERAVHKGTGAQGLHLYVEEFCF